MSLADPTSPFQGSHWLDRIVAEQAAHYGLPVAKFVALMSGAAAGQELIEQEGEPMTDDDHEDFKLYLRQCTDRQVQSVYEKERDAGRIEYRRLAEAEAERRGIVLDR